MDFPSRYRSSWVSCSRRNKKQLIKYMKPKIKMKPESMKMEKAEKGKMQNAKEEKGEKHSYKKKK